MRCATSSIVIDNQLQQVSPTSCSAASRPLLLCLFALLGAAPAAAQNAEVQTTWRLLDYIAVDYRGAVRDGRIVSDGEYEEMAEFTASVTQRLAALAGRSRPRRGWSPAPRRCRRRSRARPRRPRSSSWRAGSPRELIAAYPVPLAPRRMPDLARGPGALRRELRLLPRRRRRRRRRRSPPAWIRRRSPSPTARAPASAACSRSTR